jgi:outer membrane immunogenic protein
MKKFLIATAGLVALAAPALAADMAPAPYTKAPPVMVAPIYNWTGFYIGGNVGGAWENGSSTEVPSGVFVTTFPGQALPLAVGSRSGFTGGGQFGYNWQASAWVFGLEADFNYLGFGSKSAAVGGIGPTFFGSGAAPNTLTYNVGRENFFGTVRGRIGYAWDRVLLYVTGGLAYGNGFTNSVTYTNAAPGVIYATFQGNSGNNVGGTVGAGVEVAMGNGWSVKGEYLYVDLNNHNRTLLPTVVVGVAATGASFADSGGDRFSVARVGLNYKFGGPVVAKY